MECQNTIKKLKINKEKSIGKIVIVVEGESEEFKLLKNQEELQQYITALIEYFTKADLSCVNVKEYFEKNLAGQDFERQLIRQLKK